MRGPRAVNPILAKNLECHVFPAITLTVGDLFSGPFFFDVPGYQRSFEWTDVQASQLVEDLIESAQSKQTGKVHQGYFLGTILLMDKTEPTLEKLTTKIAPRSFDVVDGQQRLITLQIIFCVLRDLVEQLRSNEKSAIAAMLNGNLGGRFRNKNERQRLNVLPENAQVFSDAILAPDATTLSFQGGEGLTLSNAALLGVRCKLRETLMDLSRDERRAFLDYLMNDCHVVVIVSSDIDRAHRTFMVLNERGKKLQRNAILKADLLSQLKGQEADAIGTRWDTIARKLGDKFETLFSHLRAVYGETDDQIVAGIRKLYERAGGARVFFDEAVEPLGEAYFLIKQNGGQVLPADLARPLHSLNRLAEGDWVPLAMLALNDWQSDPARAARIMYEVDRQAYLSRIRKVNSSRRVSRMNRLISVVRNKSPVSEFEAASRIDRDEIRGMCHQLQSLHKTNSKHCKLILMRLSEELNGGPEDIANIADYSVEHILPQNIGKGSPWRVAFDTNEKRERCTESIGNLIVVSSQQNKDACNKAFDLKVKSYVNASGPPPLAITRDILSVTEWTPEVIIERERRLLALMSKIWNVDLTKAGRNGF